MQSYKDGDTYQLDLVTKIQEKLDDYNKALIQQYNLHQIPDPTHFDLTDIHNLLWSDAMGAGAMRGSDVNIYGHGDDPELHALDLAALCPREKHDVFSQWI
ncbi:hypothetical protein N0V83_003382 [Neocucurbitaria cava]|uniref:DUF6594 domain-containing protein n=1 Tax=Neocucurbitaria cava TaxID=798079 RepID=A0A9W8YC51_9PLEO|nr:hypothetical protein N0V83_003382 [Neocucurbitaria cava]